MVRDSETMRKSKIIHDVPNVKLQSLKNDIIVNPEGLSPISVDKTMKRYPVHHNISLLSGGDGDRVNLRTPQIPSH